SPATDRRQQRHLSVGGQAQGVLGKFIINRDGTVRQQPGQGGVVGGQPAAQVADGGAGGQGHGDGVGPGQVPGAGKEAHADGHRSTRSRIGSYSRRPISGTRP